MAEPYDFDFPELISPPARTYGNTLVLNGIMERDQAMIRLVALNMIVKIIVEATQDPNSLGCIAPELISAPRILDEVGYIFPDEPNNELLACVNKAARILRREMEPSELWVPNPLQPA